LNEEIEQFRHWIVNTRKFAWFCLLFGFLAVFPEFTGSFRTSIFAVAGILVVAPIVVVVHQRLRPSSLGALMSMATIVIVAACLLLLLMIWNIFYRQNTFWVVGAFWPIYVLVTLGTCFFAFRYARTRWRSSVLWLKVQVDGGQINMEAVAHFMFGHPSLAGNKKWAWAVKPAVAAAALVTVFVTGIGGTKYLFAILGLVSIPIFIPPVISMLTKYWYYVFHFGGEDIQIMTSGVLQHGFRRRNR
jgi:hypothetical protein